MSQEINPNESLNQFDTGKLPTSVNVLTILTIIWSCISVLLSIWGFISAKNSYEKTREALSSGKMDEMPKFMKGMINNDMLAMQQKMLENRLPILIIGLVALALCIYGAVEMRKLKKQGYLYWLIGELLPVVSTLLFIGAMAFKGFGLLGLLIPVVFIILYTVNRKYLVY